MPVNMDPLKRRHRRYISMIEVRPPAQPQKPASSEQKPFGEETEEDRVKALADAERKNLWDATEVIDMDTW